MLVANRHFRDAKAAALADARAFAGRLAPTVVTPEGLTKLVETVEALGPRGYTVQDLDAAEDVDAAAARWPCAVVAGISRSSPRRGYIALYAASVTNLATGRYDPIASTAAARATAVHGLSVPHDDMFAALAAE